MSSNRGRPTPSEWAAIESEFRDLYLVQNKTLKHIKEHFAERGFRATDRQFKTKVKAWGCDQKKIPGHVWHAMFVVLNDRARSGLSSAFIVPIRGADSALIKVDKIRKQINRDQTIHDWSNVQKAREILDEKEIKVFREEEVEITYHQNQSQHTQSPTGYSHQETDLEGRASGSNYSTGSTSPGTTVQGYTSITPSTTSTEPVGSGSFWMGHTQHQQPMPGITLHHPSICQRHNSNEERVIVAPYAESVSLFDRSKHANLINSAFLDPSLHTPPQNDPQSYMSKWNLQELDAEKQLAMQWISPYLHDYLSRHDNPVTRFRPKAADAGSAFRIMLQRSNRYVFVYCSWMVTVLAASGQTALLSEFLTDSCDIIKECPENYLMTYGSPFHLIQTLYAGSKREIDARYDEFVRSSSLIHTLWGEASPNFLVTQCYLAWLKLDQQDHREALRILSRCVIVSEQVMGSHNVITINCLAILSRAQAEMNLTSEAITTLENVLRRLVNCHQFLQAYRARQMLRLADLQLKTGNPIQAEQILREVMNFRIEHFGMDSGATDGAITRLTQMLVSQGRLEEAHRLTEHTKHQFDNETQARWLGQNG